MLNLHITDEDELYRLGSTLAGFLAVDIARDPQIVVRGYEVLQATLEGLDRAVGETDQRFEPLYRTAGRLKYELVGPMKVIRDAAEAIKAGREYPLTGVGAAFALVVQAQIGVRSAAREYQK